MRPLLGLLLAALLLLQGCGDDATTTPEKSPSADSGSPTPVVPKPGGDTPEGQPPVDGPLPDTRTGAVPVRGIVACSETYSVESARSADFAFDGTVTAIGEGNVTFEVHEWFVGDGPQSFTVSMWAPTRTTMSESSPSYFVGTRLLVSGDDGMATPCGFTRYYDQETAAAWRS